MEAAFEKKYTELAAKEKQDKGEIIHHVEVGCKGFIGTSIQCFLWSLGITGFRLKKVLKVLAYEAEQRELLALAQTERKGVRKRSNW